ncbi:MAG TPA: 2OG-Fe(II) oxygenase family protein [Trebonia sp.]|jgi:isopenicillin N synthase-like dioxygenase|nr:2OG-Fe(II) oxygenase family protein [Trebonia sp.]
MTAFTVPTVDLASSSPAEFVAALSESSCLFITGHGVPARLTAAMAEVSTAFFDLPREHKLPTRWPGDGLWRGWQPVYEGAADLTGGRVPDLLERFEVALSGPRDGSLEALASTFSLWPSEPPGFAGIWTRYYAALGGLASRLMTAVIETLGLPAEAAAAWTGEHYANLVAINYIAQETPPAPGQLRIRQHTDRGGLTLLWADQSPGGLEVMLPHSREWVPVLIPDGAFLVQAGDLLARWTSHVIRPNIHRVVNPPAELAATSRRISIPYFHYPRLDLLVEAAPSCLPAGGARRPARPVIAGEHAFRRQEDYKETDGDGIEEAVAAALAR